MYKIYQVKIGDTLTSIAQKLNTTENVIKKLNSDLFSVEPGQNIIVPSFDQEKYKIYVVKNGDSMYNIAKINDIPLEQLLSINGINQNDYIYPNQTILIPNNISTYITLNDDTIQKVIEKTGNNCIDLLKENSNIFLLPDQVIFYKKNKL